MIFSIVIIYYLFILMIIGSADSWRKLSLKIDSIKSVEKQSLSIKDTCEHSWHTLINEQQGEQKIIIIERMV